MNFQKKLASGKFVVLAEMNTPKGVDISELVTNANRIKGRVDAVIIPDMDNGVMRMSSLGGGVIMRQHGLDPIIHAYCRDRNRMALQGDILAAHVLGIKNIIVTNSEEMAKGDHLDAKPVNDLDEVGLISAIKTLQKGVDMAGFELKGNPDILTGCTITSCADEKALDMEIELTKKKLEAGAQYVIAPYVFDMEYFTSFMEKVKGLGVPVIPTVFLLKSVGIARYMAKYEPGAHISEQTIKRIRKSSDREMECIQIAGETITALKKIVQGVKIQTLGWEHKLPAILDAAGI